MKFSVIVPVYRVEKYIRQCIESVLNQTYKDFELILVDDGSPDNCPRICDEYALKDERVVVVHKVNGGVSSARNAGLAVSKGEYFLFVDGDDLLSEDYCKKFAEVAEQFSPEIIICGFETFDEKEKTANSVKEKEGFYTREKIEREIFYKLIESYEGEYFAPSVWAKAFKREKFSEYFSCIDEKIKIGEDQAIVKPCVFSANTIYVLNENIYFYRKTENSATNAKNTFDMIGAKLIAKHFEKNIDLSLFDFQEQVYRRTVHDLFNAAVSQFNGKDGYKAAKARIKTALKDEYYKTAIKRCKFKVFSKGWLAKKALEHKLYFLMKIYNGRG